MQSARVQVAIAARGTWQQIVMTIHSVLFSIALHDQEGNADRLQQLLPGQQALTSISLNCVAWRMKSAVGAIPPDKTVVAVPGQTGSLLQFPLVRRPEQLKRRRLKPGRLLLCPCQLGAMIKDTMLSAGKSVSPP